MGRFIDIKDYDATVHREILDAVTREDKSIIKICEDRAMEEMAAYISERYDHEAIFNTTGKSRLQIVLMFCLDISIYHIFCVHNPQKLSETRKDRYERAVEWLKAVQRGQINIIGAPTRERTASSAPYIMVSNPKRVTHR